jgi:hypothetical protein
MLLCLAKEREKQTPIRHVIMFVLEPRMAAEDGLALQS